MQVVPSSTFVWSGVLQDLKKLCISGQLSDALCAADYYSKQGLPISISVFFCLLQKCIEDKNLRAGRQIYLLAIRNGFELDTFLGCHLVRMFSACGSLLEADQTFSKLLNYDSFTWTAIISAHVKVGRGEEALKLYTQMLQDIEPVDYTFNTALQACSSTAALRPGNIIHSHIVENSMESDVCIGNTLINMYIKCGSVEDAGCVFDSIPTRNTVAWSSIISGYADESNGQKALQLFNLMLRDGPQPNVVTFLGILRACANMACLIDGKLVHALIIENNIVLDLKIVNILIDMYGKCGSVEDADLIFHRLFERTVITWSTMLSLYADYGHSQVTLHVFQQMQHEGVEPDCATFAGVLKACSQSHIGYVHHGFGQEALKFCCLMQEENKSDNVMFLCTLKVCSLLSALHQGRLVHAQFTDSKWEADTLVRNSLIDMYSKCGSLQDAFSVFSNLRVKTTPTWNTMISAFAHHSNYPLALKLFEHMQHEGLEPNNATFASLLAACNQFGLVHEGFLLFNTLSSKYGITPKVDHYACFVELLSRAGCLLDAVSLVTTSPFAPDLVTWTSLLNQSKAHGDLELGKQCLDSLVTIDGVHSSGYAIMSTFLADVCLSEDADNMQVLRKQAKAWKKPGEAFIAVNDEVCGFIVHDQSQKKCQHLGRKLQRISAQMKRENYMPLVDLVFYDACDQKSEFCQD